MKVLGICGSPRKHGSTDSLLDRALEGARESGAITEKITLNELSFKPCQECGGCDKTGLCIINDDMQALYKKIDDADAVILASPVFFANVTAQAKSMIDRFQCRWIARNVLKDKIVSPIVRKGLFICVSGTDKKEFFENALLTVKSFFYTVGIRDIIGLYFGGVEKSTDLSDRKDILEKVFDAGSALAKGQPR